MGVSLAEALYCLTNDQLKEYAALLSSEKKPTQKAALVELIEGQLKKNLQKLWDVLDQIDQLAIAETLYSRDCTFDSVSFSAKYGKLPSVFGRYVGYRQKPPLLSLFLRRATIARNGRSIHKHY